MSAKSYNKMVAGHVPSYIASLHPNTPIYLTNCFEVVFPTHTEPHTKPRYSSHTTTEMSQPTPSPSSIVGPAEKPEIPEDEDSATEEKGVDAPQPPPVSYPKGIEMLFIMLALVLSITLISLDQVSSTAPSLSHSRLLPIHHTPLS